MKKTLITLGATATLVGGLALSHKAPVTPVVVVQDPVAAAVAALPEARHRTPKAMLSSFNNEVQLGVDYDGVSATTSRRVSAKKQQWVDKSITVETVDLTPAQGQELGGVEINLILDVATTTNAFTFTLSGTENLDFFYQAPLWEEMGLKGPQKNCTDTDCTLDGKEHRPVNVVGSYAVYYHGHRDHIEGQTNYGDGKAYHIYRPLVTDAKGKTVWASMSYANSVLTVTVPQDFLNTATYPVTIDPTFGKTSQGGTGNNMGVDVAEVSHYALSDANVTVTKLSSWVVNGTALGHNFKAVLYSDSAAKPFTLLGVSAAVPVTMSTVLTDYTLTSPAVLAAAGTYWLGLTSDNIDNSYWFDTGAANSAYFDAPAGNFTSPVNPWTDFSSSRTRLQSTFATYTLNSSPIYVNTLQPQQGTVLQLQGTVLQ